MRERRERDTESKQLRWTVEERKVKVQPQGEIHRVPGLSIAQVRRGLQ
jgi:hypothetical protein